MKRITKVKDYHPRDMRKYVFQVFYLGVSYFGFQRQLNGATIENYLELAFIKTGLIRSFSSSGYRAASRTDAGVNAKSNIFVLNLTKEPNLIEVNDNLPDGIIITKFGVVPDDFNPRKALHKLYSYYLPDHFVTYNLERISAYEGYHNFDPFIKSDGAGAEEPHSSILSITIENIPGFKKIQIRGDKFGREQIRRMIGFFLQKKYADFNLENIFSDGTSLDIRSAPAEYLVLDRIEYPIDIDFKQVKTDYLRERSVQNFSNTSKREILYLLLFEQLF
ncbi:MAG: hypothetical protein ACXAE3_06875 [Candidatus Kariarchaeaceae archaeon]|jgi:tRNA pseudouridine(38-40) synthase